MSANGSLIVRLETGALARAVSRGVAWPRRLALPAQKGGGSLHPSPPPCKQHLIIYFLSRNAAIGTHTDGGAHVRSYQPRSRRTSPSLPSSPPPPPADNPLMSDWASVCVCARRRCRRVTYGRVEGEGALALENPVSRAGHPDGGHVRDQQLSEVCSHLRIPASGTTVPRSHRSSAVRGEDAIFKALRRYIPAASRDVTLNNIKIKRQQGRRARGYTRGCEATTPCRLGLVCFASSSSSPSSCTKKKCALPCADITSTVDFGDVSSTRLFTRRAPPTSEDDS